MTKPVKVPPKNKAKENPKGKKTMIGGKNRTQKGFGKKKNIEDTEV